MSRKFFYVLGTTIMLMSLILSACAGPAATTEAPEATAVPEVVFEPLKVEAADCEYGGLIKSIEAVDQYTVKFTMCVPDPAFPSKIAFTSFAIQPKEWLEKAAVGETRTDLLEKPIGTGPYMVSEWKRGDELILKANPDYWGDKAKAETLVFRWSSEAAQRLLELQAGTVDGIDNPGPDDFATIEADANLKLVNRPALNIFYVGFNNKFAPFDNEKVRQAVAMAIDRQRIVDNFFPAGSEVASHFTPCAIPNGCVGESWYEFDVAAAKALLADAGFPDGFETTLYYRDVVRGYLPQPGVVAQDIQAQLLENLNIKVTIEVQESGTFLDNADSGSLNGLHLLGWGADYPDMTNFLDYHFGAGSSKQFGDKFTDITDALKSGAALAKDSDREPFYVAANNAIKTHVPMVPISHGGSAVAYKAAVEGGHASPLGNEYFAVVSSGADTFVWMQNAEPISLYCADETDGESLRACEQVTEALLSYQVGGTAVEPGLAEACNANADLTEWTCNLRKNVKFHDGSLLDANDVVFTLQIQWDAAHPLHTGNTGAFSYWSGLWGPFLNAPPAE
jgi:ABC-type transport system substrate-binding protein